MNEPKHHQLPVFWLGLAGALCVAIFAIRISGPSDLEGYSQHRNVGYVMDIMWEGHWLAQRDIQGRILSKPPLHSWTVAPFAMVLGVNRLTLTIPSFLAVFVLAVVVFEVGRRRFSLLAGGLAALVMILAPPMAKHIALVRSDPLFTLAVTAIAFAAFNAWETGKGWSVFWFVGALATLTKGPLSVLLAGSGLISYFWEKQEGSTPPPLRGPHGKGITIFLALTLSWFLVAWLQYGRELIDKLFLDELLGQAVGLNKGFPGKNLPKPTLYLLVRFLPFSPFAFYGIWRVFHDPAGNFKERRFERFLTCWVVTGLLIFSLAAHHRPDLLLPLWPACALLAGRELARFAERLGWIRFRWAFFATCLLLVGGVYLTYHLPWGKRADKSYYTEQVRAAAAALDASDVDPLQLYHLDTPVTFQMHLHTYRPWMEPSTIERLVSTIDEPIYIATGERSLDDVNIDLSNVTVERVFRWPEDNEFDSIISIFRIQ